MRHSLLTLCLLCAGPALAEPWQDARWPDMIRDAELIARVKVTEGGLYGARVVVEEVFAGEAPPGPFTFVGFNNPAWPLEGVYNEQLKTGDTAWIFANRWQGPRFPEEPTPWLDEGVSAPAGETWVSPAPFAGDVPLRPEGVHVHLLRSGYPNFARPIPVEDWESALRTSVARIREGRRDEAALGRARRCVSAPSPVPLGRPDQEDPDATCLGRLIWMGEQRWDPRFAAYAGSSSAMTRAAAAVLGVQTGDPRANGTIVRGFLDEFDLGRTVLAHEARAVRREEIGELLAPLLAAARSERPTGLPVPVETLRPEEARRRLVEALGFLATDATIEALLAELPYLNPDILFVALDLLQKERPGSWVKPVLSLVQTPEPTRLQMITEVIRTSRATEAKAALEDLLRRPDLDISRQTRVWWALEAVGDAESARMARERLTPRLRDGMTWDPDTVDLVGAELGAVGALEKGRAIDLGWEVARLYFGWPGEVGEPAVAGVWLPLTVALRVRALAQLPEGSTVKVRILARDARKVGRVGGERPRVQLDAHVPSGLTKEHRAKLAAEFEIPESDVRVCGVGEAGTFACYESRGSVWTVHQLIGIPLVKLAAEAAGVGPFAWTGDPKAITWLRLFEAAGLVHDAESTAFLDEYRRPPPPTVAVKAPIPGVTPMPGAPPGLP